MQIILPKIRRTMKFEKNLPLSYTVHFIVKVYFLFQKMENLEPKTFLKCKDETVSQFAANTASMARYWYPRTKLKSLHLFYTFQGQSRPLTFEVKD